MSLDLYNKKRDFSRTPEPKGGKPSKDRSDSYSYVIQKHEASHLHYDFRLEIDGVLKSWAVPKGPSLNPDDKRLAMQTEDHPLDYGQFEGVIPAPGYGAGTVMLWDTGQWRPEGEESKSLEKGKLDFELQGKRLRGHWSLVRMHGRKTTGKEWLLIKRHDRYASDEDVTQRYERSVTSRRTMKTIEKQGAVLGRDASTTGGNSERSGQGKPGKGSVAPKEKRARSRKAVKQTKSFESENKSATAFVLARLADDSRARSAAMPDPVQPQLATLYQSVPEGDNWLHEIKYDGYRMLVYKDRSLRLLTRNGKDWTHKFPHLAAAFTGLPPCLLDGELVHLDRRGVSSFEGLQQALQAEATDQLILYLFDLIHFDGRDLRQVTQKDRKQYLEALVKQLDHPNVRFSEHIEGHGDAVLQHACEHGLEGIISKDAAGRYTSSRSRQWRKIKCSKRQEFVLIGFTEGTGSRQGFGALLLGYYDGGRLRYAGKVGTGFDTRTLVAMRAELEPLRRSRSPLAEKVSERGAVWIKPVLVAEIEFTEWTSANRLRHPVFLGLRRDKDAADVVREAPEDKGSGEPSKAVGKRGAVASPAPELPISHPDKVLYPKSGVTKQELAEYYLMVADWMLPYVAGRPLSLVRCPHGHTGHCFFQKHPTEGFGEALRLVEIEEKSGTGTYAYVDSAAGLVELVQMGTLEIHAWGSTIKHLEKPDILVFDLDPDEGVSWLELKSASVYLREFLDDLGLQSFLRTTGGKGLHLVVPVNRRQNWDEAKAFCKAVADFAVVQHPDRYIATASKAKRKNKIFIDYLRNGRGSTSVCSYSTRSREGAPVAVPLAWQELDGLESSQAFQLRTVEQRLSSLKKDPWEGFFEVRQSLTKRMWSKLS